MTAIRKTTLQVAYFQFFTNLTTELYTSNDRFGLNWNGSISNRTIKLMKRRFRLKELLNPNVL